MGIRILYDWLFQSNRPTHVKAGMFVFLVMFAFCFLPLGIPLDKSAIVALVTTVIAAIVVVLGLSLVVYNQIIPNEYVPADDEIALHMQLDTEEDV